MLRCSSDKVREELWSKDDPPLHEVVALAKRVEHTLACVEELEKGKSLAVNKISMKKELSKKDGDCDKQEDKIQQEQCARLLRGKVCGMLSSEHAAEYGILSGSPDVIFDVRLECRVVEILWGNELLVRSCFAVLWIRYF
ncbi:hypothetical protein NDU88_004006 [Pleurodeles waltl]|uniref:Uncharacterized protein n=1 Tax=Pleurodeles waltl TaxID=8319 RepID=A0AAV7UPN0_PLEWA|nr:hypothetical protein NDU88_006651 [Pleurodeles waltl]KAJ1208623.1 hypothetical protein NDU88_004006 [Pleurodeles waltl]